MYYIGEGYSLRSFLVSRCECTRMVTGLMGAPKNKEKPTAVPFCSVKTCPNFHRMLPSTVEEFSHFVRSWKIVAEFFLLTMVIRIQELGQVFTVGRNG
jgi:hypothetical protein